eukprot:scaffold1160_cov120-Skeletonema_menzelii.AAC.3
MCVVLRCVFGESGWWRDDFVSRVPFGCHSHYLPLSLERNGQSRLIERGKLASALEHEQGIPTRSIKSSCAVLVSTWIDFDALDPFGDTFPQRQDID